MFDLRLFGLLFVIADCLMSDGTPFHNLAAATAKVLLPYLWTLSKYMLLFILHCEHGWFLVDIWVTWIALWVRDSILHLIPYSTGNQCWCCRAGVMWWNFFSFRTNLDAFFGPFVAYLWVFVEHHGNDIWLNSGCLILMTQMSGSAS